MWNEKRKIDNLKIVHQNYASQKTKSAIYQVPKENHCDPRILYSGKMFFKNERLNTFLSNNKKREFVA